MLASSGRRAGGGGGLADLGPPGTDCRAAASWARWWRGSPGFSPLPPAPAAGLSSSSPGRSLKDRDARQSEADQTAGLL